MKLANRLIRANLRDNDYIVDASLILKIYLTHLLNKNILSIFDISFEYGLKERQIHGSWFVEKG